MTSYKLQLVFTIVLINTLPISCKKYGSLSLVIDETASMRNEIDVLKNEAYKLIDNIVGNKSNQFDDMVMVTFGDLGKPKVQVFQNNDKIEVKEALGSIKVSGGSDCPEFSLSAIKAALNHSKPNSCLFVFTDASPKDGYVKQYLSPPMRGKLHKKERWVLNATLQSKEISEVIKLAQKKNSQIFFFITPSADVDFCREESHLFKPYWDIANATSGLAFKLNKKTDLETFLDFTKIAISEESEKAAKEISPNETKDLKFDVNHRTEYFMVAVSAIGTKAELEVTKYGHNTEYHHYINRKMLIRGHSRILWNADSKIERVLYPLPGKYIATVRGQSATVIKVNYRKEFTFTHTFEKRVPPTFKNESIELIDGLKYVLLVKVSGLSNNYSIATAQIESIDGKIIYEKLSLTKVLESDDYYVTERFMPPSSTLFLVTIIGRCKITGRINVQTATTPNQSRKMEMSRMMIHGEKQYKYNSTFELTCHLNAYPKPEITWSNDEGVILPASSLEQKNETEYESKLLIKNFKTQDRFYCSVNYNGNTYKKSIDVKPITPFIIEEDDCPANITSTKIIEIGSSTILYCNITSELPMGIEWYLLPEYKEVKNSSDFIILNDGRQITVKNVKEDTAGIYVCQATLKEDYEAKYVLERRVEIKRLPPYAGEKADEIVMENESLSIKCNVSKAYPKPNITWQFQEYGNNIFHTLPQQGETLTISNATYNSAGFYECKATNIMGNDEHLTEVTVLISPKISLLVNGKEETNITVEYADKNDTFLACKVISHPGVEIAWINERNASVAISNKTHCDLYYCVNILKLSQLIRSEKYYCRAVNNMDTIESDYISINVISPFIVDSTNATEFKNKTIEFGSPASLNCNITSKFPMKIDWYLDSEHKEVKNSSNYIVSNNGRQITINEINEDTSGKYICQATLTEDNTTKYELEMNVDIELSPPLAGKPENVEATENETLSIKCNISKTYPIPYVTWQFQEYGSKSFRPLPQKGEVLTIHEVNYLSVGSYKCNATNMMGSDEHVTAVTVKFLPKVKLLMNGKEETNVNVEFADKNETILTCTVISHAVTNISWFNGKHELIKSSNYSNSSNYVDVMELSQLKKSEKYYCTAKNNVGTTTSSYVFVNVSSPFTIDRSNEFNDVMKVNYGEKSLIKCGISSDLPINITWQKGNVEIEKGSEDYSLLEDGTVLQVNHVGLDTEGNYTCKAFIVGNEQIQATRATTIEVTACFINLHSTTKKSPLVVEWPLGSWPGSLTTIGQHLSVNSNEELLLSCHNHSAKPNVFQNLPDESEIIATCEHGDKFKVRGKIYSLSELQCKTEVTPVVQETGEKCAYENTETVKVGYNVQTSEPTFLEIYTTCFDKTKKVPVYTKVNITEHDFSGVVEPVRQKYNKSHSEDNRRFCIEGSQCCLEKIQLVNQLDVMQESMKYATFINGFNTVPYWRGCDGTGDNDSWAAIENNIRKNIRNPIVLSGAYDYINNNGTMIPRYLWKIIFTQRSQPRDIIVKVNDPSPTERDFRCKTACGVSWLKHKNVYCCDVKEFKKAFNIPIVDL